jgi:hypothetical protein
MVADTEEKAMGDLVRLEEYDFDMNSISLIKALLLTNYVNFAGTGIPLCKR